VRASGFAASVALFLMLGLITAATAAAPRWTGVWRIDFTGSTGGIRDGASTLRLVQRGVKVTGSFPFQWQSDKGFGNGYCFTGRGGTIRGTVRGRTLTGVFLFPAGQRHARATATLTATLAPNGRKLEGRAEFTTGECSKVLTLLIFTGRKTG
jgi:hypothetical protein